MHRTRTILIAEDDPASRELLAELLRAAGYLVFEATDGAEVVTLFQRQRPDLAILDIQMPKLDGFAVLDYLHRHAPQPLPPVMAVTAHALVGDRERALAHGFDDYLTKPLEIDLLRRRIIELLG